MKTSVNGIKLIKKYEGCRLKAYKPVKAERYWTIGWGHYGPDVIEGMTISQARADELLVADLRKYEDYVTATGLTLTQNQYDALVSFTYNCGSGNLQKLIKGRDYQQIADAMLKYNKGSGKELPGLTKRRTEERKLFLADGVPASGNTYLKPTRTLKKGHRGADVMWLQTALNERGFDIKVDGIFGPKTELAVRDWQDRAHLVVDGLVGRQTIASLS